MRATYSAQGGHEILKFHTNSVILLNRVIPALITPTIINKVHSIADRECIPSGIKISNRTGLYYMTVPVLQELIIQKMTTMKINLRINKEIRKTMIRNHQTMNKSLIMQIQMKQEIYKKILVTMLDKKIKMNPEETIEDHQLNKWKFQKLQE